MTRGRRENWANELLVKLFPPIYALIYALYFFPANPFLYFEGMALVNADHRPGHLAYMAGAFQEHFWSYYVVTTSLLTLQTQQRAERSARITT